MDGRHRRSDKPTGVSRIPDVRDETKLCSADAEKAGRAIGTIRLLLLKQQHRRLILWSVLPGLDSGPAEAQKTLAELDEIVAFDLPH